jgi:hypothetical protein
MTQLEEIKSQELKEKVDQNKKMISETEEILNKLMTENKTEKAIYESHKKEYESLAEKK